MVRGVICGRIRVGGKYGEASGAAGPGASVPPGGVGAIGVVAGGFSAVSANPGCAGYTAARRQRHRMTGRHIAPTGGLAVSRVFAFDNMPRRSLPRRSCNIEAPTIA